MSLHPISTAVRSANPSNDLVVWDIYVTFPSSYAVNFAATYNSPQKAFNTLIYNQVHQYIGDIVTCKIYRGYVPDHPDTTADDSLPDNALDEANLMAEASYTCVEENFTSLNTVDGVNRHGVTDLRFDFDVDLSAKNLISQVSDIPPCFTVYFSAISGGGTGNVPQGTAKSVGQTVWLSRNNPPIYLSPEDDAGTSYYGNISSAGGAGNMYYHVPAGNAGDGGLIFDITALNNQDHPLACDFFYRSKTPFGSVRSMTDSPTFMITNKAALPSLDVFSLTIGKATDPFGSGEDYYGYSSTTNGGWLGSNIGAVNQTYFTFPTTGVTKLAPNITGSDSAYGVYIYMDSLEANLPDNSFTSITANGVTLTESSGSRSISGGLATYFWTVSNLNFLGHATAPAVGSNVTITWA